MLINRRNRLVPQLLEEPPSAQCVVVPEGGRCTVRYALL